MTDEAEIAAVIEEMYAMVSGPAGPRDWSRNENCFLDDALQIRTWVDDQGRASRKSMNLDEYSQDAGTFLAEHSFYEKETSHTINVFGNIAHAWSSYEARTSIGDAEPERRGVNSIQLFKDPDKGWRIINMIWDNER